MSSLGGLSSIPVEVPSVSHVEFFRRLSGAAKRHGGIAIAPSDGADREFGLASLGETDPAAYRLVLADLHSPRGFGLNFDRSADAWRVSGGGHSRTYPPHAGPRLVLGNSDHPSSALAPVLVATSQQAWMQVHASDAGVAPALLPLPVVSPGGQFLLRMALAADTVEADRSRRVRHGGEPDRHALAIAAGYLGLAAELVEAHPEAVIRDLVRVRNEQPTVALDAVVGSRLQAAFAFTDDRRLEDAVLRWEAVNGFEPAWTDSMIARARLPMKRAIDAIGFDLAYRFEAPPARFA